jgi:YbbR domain-containing protein
MFLQVEKLLRSEDRQLSIRRLLRRVFLEDRMIKVIALFITFALWYGVTGLRAPTTARLRNVALNMRLSNDMEVTNSPVQEVDLVVTGDKRRIETINPRDLLVSLDLTEVSAGDNTIQILPENVSRSVELPTGVRLEEVQPNKIAVRLEKVQEREIEVKIEIEGSVAENFEVYNQTVVPQRVRVRGPESFVNSLDFVSTERINLNNQRANFTVRQVPVLLNAMDIPVTETKREPTKTMKESESEMTVG